MFSIKICGITRFEDAQDAFAAGADAIGLNFYPQSKRYLSPDQGYEICQQVNQLRSQYRHKLWVVGLFVNAQPKSVVEIATRLRLDAIQFHGDEPAQLANDLKQQIPLFAPIVGPAVAKPTPIFVRAIRWPVAMAVALDGARQKNESIVAGSKSPETSKIYENNEQFSDPSRIKAWQEIEEWVAAGIDAILLDAADEAGFGGTGKRLDWQEVRLLKAKIRAPIVLAGGLDPQNVAAAIAATEITRVDVASGVELSPGIKDPTKVLQFVANCRLRTI